MRLNVLANGLKLEVENIMKMIEPKNEHEANAANTAVVSGLNYQYSSS
jgi:hypothetical protein